MARKLADDLLARAIACPPGQQRETELAELEYLLRYSDNESDTVPVAVSTTKVTMMCGTCGYETDFGTIEARDAEHLRYDGAHEPGWHADDDDATLVRNDLELIRVIVATS
jgi:hypothetical protein